MNAAQVKYARERAASIKNKLEKAIARKHTTQEVRLSGLMAVEALRSGAFQVREDGSRKGYGSLRDYIKFNAEVEQSFDQEAAAAELQALSESYTSLTDQLVLGEAEEALKLLLAFEKYPA